MQMFLFFLFELCMTSLNMNPSRPPNTNRPVELYNESFHRTSAIFSAKNRYNMFHSWKTNSAATDNKAASNHQTLITTATEFVTTTERIARRNETKWKQSDDDNRSLVEQYGKWDYSPLSFSLSNACNSISIDRALSFSPSPLACVGFYRNEYPFKF